MAKKSLISIQDFTKEEILHILDVAEEFVSSSSLPPGPA